MSRFQRHPTEPDRKDDRHSVAVAVYEDALAYLQRGERIPSVLTATLYWLGYRKWMLPNNGFTPPETPRRRERFVRDLRTLGKTYEAAVLQQIESLGYSRPPDRKAKAKFEQLDPYVEVANTTISWGLKDTLLRGVIFHARYDIMRLEIVDGGNTLDEATRRPSTDGWNHNESLTALGLGDDDYRFYLWLLNSAGGSRARYPFDYAKVDDAWTRLEFQGSDWDGEYAS